MKTITILDYSTGEVAIYHYSGKTKKSDEELVIKFGHQPSQCHWLLTDKLILTINVKKDENI